MAQEYLWLDWFFFSREGLLLAFCFYVFVLKCYACCAWKINNLYKEYVNRPTHTSQETHAHRLFVQGRPLLRKNDLFSVSPAPHITDRLNDWAFCVCVNGLSRVGICIKVTAMEIGEMLNEQDRVRKSERGRGDGGKEKGLDWQREKRWTLLCCYPVSKQESVSTNRRNLSQELLDLSNIGRCD